MSELYSETKGLESSENGWGSERVVYNQKAVEHLALLLKFTDFAQANPVGMVKLMDIAKRQIEDHSKITTT